MSEPAPQPELMRSLGRLVRGLSGLFWGLPLALLVAVQSLVMEWLRPMGFLPPVMAAGLLLYALWEIGHFHARERPWRNALEIARVLALVNLGLSPFLYWWNRVPEQVLFLWAVRALAISGLLFLTAVNGVLVRLADMLPDETLRSETRLFASVNRVCVLAILIAGILVYAFSEREALPGVIALILSVAEREQRLVFSFAALFPLAMTMALIWKTKEAIFGSVFNRPVGDG
jgi:hypothetical protein